MMYRVFPLVLILLVSAHAQSAKRTISVAPTAIDFGSVSAGGSATRTFQITNTGKFGVKISAITSSLASVGVSAPVMPYYLNAGTSVTVSVSFAPTSAGVASGTVTISSNAQNSPTLLPVSGTGTVNATTPPLTISTNALPEGTVQTSYSASLAATGGLAPYTWSLSAGALPPGLALQATGTISGTPTAAGNFAPTFLARDAAGNSALKQLSIVVASASTSPTAYGNVGDPYEGGTPLAATLISTCQTLAPNASYRLSRSLNALTPTDVCLQLTGANTTIDLNGYKVTGRITAPGLNISGTHIFNGTVECVRDAALGANVGCVWLNGDTYPASAQVRVHHLSVANAAACGRAVHVGWMTSAAYTGAYMLRMYNITSAAASGPSCSRSYNLSTTGTDYFTAEVHHNDLTCPADASACQGIMFYGTNRNRAHHNRVQLMQNTTVETARGILCDVSDHCEVDNNLIVANNNRAFRVRDGQHAWIHDNTVLQITAGGVAAVHLGDPDNPSTVSNDMNAVIENNVFEVRDGVVVMVRAAHNIWFRYNTINCAGCSGGSNLARVRTGLSTSINLENNPSAALLPSPQILVETGTAAAVCESGQASGSGTITYTAPCPN